MNRFVSQRCLRRACFFAAIASLILFLPLTLAAQLCKGNPNTGCSNEGAACAHVDKGFGASGVCTTSKGERECNCVGIPELTGIWLGNDGALYFVRQIDNTVWWAGFSNESPAGINDFHRGLRFTNVFQGTVQENTIVGQWADVPRGQSLNSGSLTLLPSARQIQRQAATGDFGATVWNRTSLPVNFPTLFFGNDIFTMFDLVKKNQNAWRDHSLLDNLKPAKAKPVAIFGTIAGQFGDADPMHVNYITEYGRSYHDFICLNGNDSPPDGDIDFNILVDRANLDAQQGFWTNGWETNHGVNATNFRNKLDRKNTLHLESIMFGGTTECGDDGNPFLLLPGWEQPGANGILANGVAIAGQLDLTDRGGTPPSARINAILQHKPQLDQRVRVSGILALDCGHGWTRPCDEDDASVQNQEIHPVYAIDFVQNFRIARPLALLTGVWASDDAGTYYLRQVDTTVWWLGMSTDEGQTFANVFKGTLQNGQISGTWADIPLGKTTNSGALTVTASGGPTSTGLTRTSVSGGFGGDSWEKLYDVGGRRVIVVFEGATANNSAWPDTPEPFELTVGTKRMEAAPKTPQTLAAQRATRAALGAQVAVEIPESAPLKLSATFAGYRAAWTIPAENLKPGTYQQILKTPLNIRTAAPRTELGEVVDRDRLRVAAKPGAAPPPEITIQYRIELAQ